MTRQEILKRENEDFKLKQLFQRKQNALSKGYWNAFCIVDDEYVNLVNSLYEETLLTHCQAKKEGRRNQPEIAFPPSYQIFGT